MADLLQWGAVAAIGLLALAYVVRQSLRRVRPKPGGAGCGACGGCGGGCPTARR